MHVTVNWDRTEKNLDSKNHILIFFNMFCVAEFGISGESLDNEVVDNIFLFRDDLCDVCWNIRKPSESYIWN